VSNNPECNYDAVRISPVSDESYKKVFYVPNNFVGPETDILQGSLVRNSSRLRNTKKYSPTRKCVTGEKAKKRPDSYISIHGSENRLEHPWSEKKKMQGRD
jgi:hypothetical protein